MTDSMIKDKLDGRACELSLVIPLFNEEEVFPQLLKRLQDALPALPDSTEVVLINDGSRDATRQLIHDACAADSRFVGVHFSRNFGHQQAVSAGLQAASGDAVAVLDGDLQDPPEILPQFLAKLNEGYDVVYAIREHRKENILKRICYGSFYRVLAWLTPIHIPLDSGDFGLLSRRVVDHLNAMPEQHRFIRGMRSYVGYRQTGLAYERDARAQGDSKYSWRKLMGLAADGIFTFSALPLRLASIMGFIFAGLSILYAIYVVVWRLFSSDGAEINGFAALAVGIFFLGSVQLICLGILGEYVGRIHNEVKRRPSYIVDEIDVQA